MTLNILCPLDHTKNVLDKWFFIFDNFLLNCLPFGTVNIISRCMLEGALPFYLETFYGHDTEQMTIKMMLEDKSDQWRGICQKACRRDCNLLLILC
jgi:hypothetical protein